MIDPRTDGARWATEYRDADYPLQELTGRVIAAFLHVHHTHGYGFLESVYRKALAIELEHRGISVEQLARYELFHRGLPIGVYEADLVAERSVILETKTGLILDPVAQATAQLPSRIAAARWARTALRPTADHQTCCVIHSLCTNRDNVRSRCRRWVSCHFDCRTCVELQPRTLRSQTRAALKTLRLWREIPKKQVRDSPCLLRFDDSAVTAVGRSAMSAFVVAVPWLQFL